MSLYAKQLASSQVYVRSQKDKDGSRDRKKGVSAPDGGIFAATATAARGGGPRAAGHGRRSGGGRFERRGDDRRGRRQSDGCGALFYVKVHALRKKEKKKGQSEIDAHPTTISNWTLGLGGRKKRKEKLTAMGSPRWLV